MPKAYQWFGSTLGNLSDSSFWKKTSFCRQPKKISGPPLFLPKKDFGGPVVTTPRTLYGDRPTTGSRPSGWFPPVIEVSLRDGNPIEENDQILIANGLAETWLAELFFPKTYRSPKKGTCRFLIQNVEFLLAWIWIACFLWWEVYLEYNLIKRQLCHAKEVLDEPVPHKVLNTRTTYPLHLVVSKTSWIWLANN